MRQYKFRGQQVGTNKWVYGSLLQCEDSFGPICHIMVQHKFPFTREHFLVRMETVGQWTGLKDKNGNDIYMGDIIRMKRRNKIDSILGPIIGFVNMDVPYGGMFVDCGDSDYMELGLDRNFTYEILGNKADHPHLLTPSQKGDVIISHES